MNIVIILIIIVTIVVFVLVDIVLRFILKRVREVRTKKERERALDGFRKGHVFLA